MKSNVMPSKKSPSKIQKKILQIDKKKFAKNGYQKTSMNEIVATAGVSKGVLFYHFCNKGGVIFSGFKSKHRCRILASSWNFRK